MRRFVCFVLAAMLCLQLLPGGVFAQGDLCAHHPGHDGACGYGEGTPCGYVCPICPVQDRIDALPGDITAENADAVAGELDAIHAEIMALMESTGAADPSEILNLDGYNAAAEALSALEGQNGGVVAIADTIYDEISGLYFTEASTGDSGTVAVTKPPEGAAAYSKTSYTIPETVTYDGETFTVTEIGLDAFKINQTITSVTLPGTVMRIGEAAFWECTKLSSINIPDSVTVIDKQAFWGCGALQDITIPASVTTIGGKVFAKCGKVTVLHDAQKTIEADAFDDAGTVIHKLTPPGGLKYESGSVFGKGVASWNTNHTATGYQVVIYDSTGAEKWTADVTNANTRFQIGDFLAEKGAAGGTYSFRVVAVYENDSIRDSDPSEAVFFTYVKDTPPVVSNVSITRRNEVSATLTLTVNEDCDLYYDAFTQQGIENNPNIAPSTNGKGISCTAGENILILSGVDKGIVLRYILKDKDGDETAVESITIPAWTTQYSLTYETNGGTLPENTQEVNSYDQAASVVLSEATKSGCTFKGWTTAADGSGNSYSANADFSVTGNHVLYAQWEEEQQTTGLTLTLKFDYTSGNTVYAPGIQDTVITGITPGTVIDLSNYWPSLLNWTNSSGQTYYFSSFGANESGGQLYNSIEMTQDKTLYARWRTTPYITVTFDLKGGSMAFAKIRKEKDSLNVGSLNDWYAPTREGYTFLGWSVEADGTVDDRETRINEDTTLYAVWEELPGIQVGQVTLKDGEYTTNGTSTTTTKPESGGYAYYKDGVLTLNNFTYSGGGKENNAVIYADQDLSIALVGSNVITASALSAIRIDGHKLRISGDSLNLTASDKDGLGIYLLGTGSGLTIENAALTISAGYYGITSFTVGTSLMISNSQLDIKVENQYGSAISCATTVIKNSEVNLASPRIAINANTALTIENSTVNAEGLISSNDDKNVTFTSGHLLVSSDSEYGAFYNKETFASLPSTYWWRTSADGDWTKNTEAPFVNNKQTYVEITTRDPYPMVTVTFDTQGRGDEPAAQEIEKGNKATDPGSLTASGYTFGGWYTEATCTNLWDFDTPVTGDLTLYAQWTKIDTDDTDLETRIEQSDITEVPEGLQNTAFNTVETIVEELTRVLTTGTGYASGNVATYDVKLQYSTDGGKTWITATEENFPTEGITVLLPYPDGTGRDTHDFMVTHMFTVTSQRLGTTAGETEEPPVTKGEDGIQVTLNGLSPVGISWKSLETEEPQKPHKPWHRDWDKPQDRHHREKEYDSDSPKTGDTTQNGLWLTLAALGLLGLTASIVAKKRLRKRK